MFVSGLVEVHAEALVVVAAALRLVVAAAADPFPDPAAAVQGPSAADPNRGAVVPPRGAPPVAVEPSAPTEEVSQPASQYACDFESA